MSNISKRVFVEQAAPQILTAFVGNEYISDEWISLSVRLACSLWEEIDKTLEKDPPYQYMSTPSSSGTP